MARQPRGRSSTEAADVRYTQTEAASTSLIHTRTDLELQINSYLILSNTLPRPASSSVRLRRWPPHRILRPSTRRRRRRRRFAEGRWHDGAEMRCGDRAKFSV